MAISIDTQTSERILIEAYSCFGPQEHPIRFYACLDDPLGSIRRVISHHFRLGIHTKVVLVSGAKELVPESDTRSLRNVGIKHGNTITVGLSTSPLPLYSAVCYEVNNLHISGEAVDKCFKHAKKYYAVEVAGVLLGREVDRGEVFIEDSAPISEGDSRSVTLNAVEIARVAENLRGQDMYIVGWYHSHLRSEPLSNIDLRLQSAYQQIYPKAVAMVVDVAKESLALYRMKDSSLPPPTAPFYLSTPTPKTFRVESDVVTLTTVLEAKESAAIVSFEARDAETGQATTFTAVVKNTGTVELQNTQLVAYVTSPDNKETLTFYSAGFDLDVGESKTVPIEAGIPASWPNGNSMVRAGLMSMRTRSWLFRGLMTAINLTQPAIYDVKLRVLQTSQKVGLAQTATYTILVKNNGNRRDSIEISWEKPQPFGEWEVRLYDGPIVKQGPFSVTVDPGASRKLILTATAPAAGRGGVELPITLRARSLTVSRS